MMKKPKIHLIRKGNPEQHHYTHCGCHVYIPGLRFAFKKEEANCKLCLKKKGSEVDERKNKIFD